MRVLMFGWEFPPHISGGLGTACYGLTRGLAYQGLDIVFVVPKAYGDEDQSSIRLVGASDVPVVQRTVEWCTGLLRSLNTLAKGRWRAGIIPGQNSLKNT